MLLARPYAGATELLHGSFLAPLLLRSIGQGLIIVPILVTVTTGVGPSMTTALLPGCTSMSQQLGGAMGLLRPSRPAIATAASVTTGSKIAGEAHGIRVAFVVALALPSLGSSWHFSP